MASSAWVADETTKPTIVRIRRARRKVASVFSVMMAPSNVSKRQNVCRSNDPGRDPEKFLMALR